MNTANKPLLMVDVDGVLSLFGFAPEHPPPGRWQSVDGVIHYLSVDAGPRLNTLSAVFALVWCSGWEEKANEYLPWALGLPGRLPYLTFSRAAPGSLAGHWKLESIDTFAGPRRALAWVDDAFDRACRDWAAARPGPTLLVSTDPAVGLTDAHVAQLLAWAAG